MVSGIHFLRDDISINRSEKKVLRGIHGAEKIRSQSMEKISSGKKFPNGYEDIFQSLYADKMHTVKNFNTRFYKDAFYSRGITESVDSSLTTMIDITTEMYRIVTESSNNFHTTDDRFIINSLFQSFKDELLNVANSTEFLGRKLLVGNFYTEKNSTFGINTVDELKGITNITYDRNVKKNSNISISYNADTKVMTMKDLESGKTENVKLKKDDIKNGKIENVRFKKFHANIILDSNFDKTKSIGAFYADPDDPENINNNFINNSIEKFSDVPLIDTDGDGIPDENEKLFGLSNIKITSVVGDISDVSSVDIILDEDLEYDGKIFEAEGNEIKLRIKTNDGRDFISNTSLSLQDLKLGNKIKIQLERDSRLREYNDKDIVQIEFDVDKNKLSIGDKFKKGDKFISLNELHLIDSIGIRRETELKFSFDAGPDAEKLNISFESLDGENLDAGRFNLLDENSSIEAKRFVELLFNKLSAIKADISSVQNALEKSFSNAKDRIDLLTAQISDVEDTDIPIEMALMTQFEIASSAGIEILNKEFKFRDLLVKILQ